MTVRTSAVRRERAREHARRDILEAAAQVFARKGYTAATLADLALAAGYAAPSLYRYFGSKEEIFRSLVELIVAEVSATFDESVDRSRPLAERLAALLSSQQRLAASRREIFDLVLGTAAPDAPWTVAGRSLRDPGAGIGIYAERLTGWLGRNATSQELRYPPEVAAQAVAGVVFAFHYQHSGDDPGSGDRIRLVVDLALHGVSP